MKFKLRQLQGVLAVAKTGSFAQASSIVAMTQPAFSQMIRELEHALGVRLFDRTTRRVDLTEAGQALVAGVRRPLDDLADVDMNLRMFALGERGRIVFGAVPSVAYTCVTRALAAFKSTRPGVKVILHEAPNDALLARVRSREIDFAVGMLTGNDPALAFEALFVDELVAVLPKAHPLGQRRRIAWKAFAAEPLILLPRSSSVRQLVEASCAATGVPCDAAYEVADMVTTTSLVRAGLGLTVLPWLSLSELQIRGLRIRRLVDPRPVRRIGVITHKDRELGAAALAFVEMLRDQKPIRTSIDGALAPPQSRPNRAPSISTRELASGRAQPR